MRWAFAGLAVSKVTHRAGAVAPDERHFLLGDFARGSTAEPNSRVQLVLFMSTRGINFLDKWLAEHLPNAITDDPVAVSDLADECIKAALREGIAPWEIDEEVGSVFEAIFEAMQHRDGSLAD